MKNQLHALDTFLNQYDWLWRAQPFKEMRPNWCAQLPALTHALLTLSDDEVGRLEQDQTALLGWLAAYVPELLALDQLTRLPQVDLATKNLNEARFGWEVPGRKQQQIASFTQSIERSDASLLEWCGGKGHLGRTLAMLWQQPIDTVEWDETLCNDGRRLSARVGVSHLFHPVDAMQQASQQHLVRKHVVALHACGDLHRRLVLLAKDTQITALDFAPCCYHLGQHAHYHAFNSELCLTLSRDDLRLAVTNTATAADAQLKLRDQEMAWKLGYTCLRQQLLPDEPYSNIAPVKKPWLKLGFIGFCLQLAAREGLVVPDDIDWTSLEQQGWQRQHEVMRLNLVRFAFRRAIEVWLVLDMVTYLQEQGFDVLVREFCSRQVTPRNILISARPLLRHP